MVVCSKCGRPSNSDRRACLYCGGELTDGAAEFGVTTAGAGGTATAPVRERAPAPPSRRARVRRAKGGKRRRRRKPSGGSHVPLIGGAIAVALAGLGLYAALSDEEPPAPTARVRKTPVPLANAPTPVPTATPEPPVLAPSSESWRSLELAAGRAIVEVPGGPLPTTLPGGGSLVLSGHSVAGGSFVFQAVHADVGRSSSETERLLDDAIQAIADSAGGYVQSKREYDFDGRPGREFWIAVRDSDDAIRCRAIVDGNELLVLTVRTRRDATDHAAVERFFTSLQLTG